MNNKEWILSDTAAGIEKLVLVGHNFLEPDFGGKITVYLRKIFTDANGVERSNVNSTFKGATTPINANITVTASTDLGNGNTQI